MENRVAHLTWDQVAARIGAGAAGLLPVGAGAKEHGLHLPMNTDQIQAEWLADAVARNIDALIWPTVTYGHYPAFVRYAGSLSLSADIFKALLGELMEGLTGFGVSRVLVVDTGISTMRPVSEAIGTLRDPGRIRHLKVHDGPRYQAAVKKLSQQRYGSHADELETSRMLALAPQLVDMRRAEASPPDDRFRLAEGPMTPVDENSPNYSRSGSYGDPTLASRAKGDVLLAAMEEDVIEMAKAALGGTVG